MHLRCTRPHVSGIQTTWQRFVFIFAIVLLCGPQISVSAKDKLRKTRGRKTVDQKLRELLTEQGVGPLDSGPVQDQEKVKLGQALFFDGELSGNRDMSCATCHHPLLGMGDGLSLPIGTAAVVPGMLGPFREIGPGREFIPRNAPEIFNRGSNEWFSLFWDSRVAELDGDFISPAGTALPSGMPNVLAVQAMFPVTSRDEMRGRIGDEDVNGDLNELALVPDDDLEGMWDAIMARLLSIPGYQDLFSAAFPGLPPEELGFEHAATAIAAFEAEAYTFLDSPWDQYLSGDNKALSYAEKRGALMFFGSAKCSNCHSGALLTDQQHYNIGVPQLGPGKGAEAPLDHGRGRETGDIAELFQFRTPPLRNCEITGPYMHNGAYSDLSAAVQHHASPLLSLVTYNPKKQLDQVEIRETYSLINQAPMAFGIEFESLPAHLSKREVQYIVKFLKSMTAPRIQERMNATIPDSVPSGLPLDN